MQAAVIQEFQQQVLQGMATYGRAALPWRQPERDGSFDPYKILVSEVMLQQTQVGRVIPKYHDFLQRFPMVQDLATAPLAKVLKAWSGLGYNRRAKFLWQAAGQVVQEYNGRFPTTVSELVKLPGVGQNTAGAVVAYAYNCPAVFIETNVRTVFIHHFFSDQEGVSDRAIADLVATTLPDNPRQWYWALMDYGTYLKRTIGNLNTLSKHYAKQSTFQGSRRQTRGQVLALLGQATHSLEQLQRTIADERLESVLADLVQEGLIEIAHPGYKLRGA